MKLQINIGILILTTCCLTLQLQAQSFEGIIRWKMDFAMQGASGTPGGKMPEMTPQQKAQLDAAMNNPQMKEMMEKNPQLKAQIEQMQKASAGGGISGMIPKGFIIQIKNGNSLTSFEGGMLAGKKVLNLKDKTDTYQIDSTDKTYTIIPKGRKDDKKPDVKVTKTNEFITVAGYKCRKYILESTQNGQTLTSNVFTTTEISGLDVEHFKKMNVGRSQGTFYTDEMEGLPMKITATNAQGNVNIEVLSVTKQSQKASDFQIPTGYTEKKGLGY